MLKERRGRILNLLVDLFLRTGEPVGSRTLSKVGLEVSPATIRNEMADLEEMGFLEQPHTSAGRVPTDKAYRFWLDQQQIENFETLDRDRAALRALDERFLRECRGLEDLLANTVKVLSQVCQLAGVASPPALSRTASRIQLVGLDSRHIMAVLVSESGVASTHTLTIESSLSQEELNKLSNMLSDGTTREGVQELVATRLRAIQSLEKEARQLARRILEQLEDALVQAETEVFYDGLSRLLQEPGGGEGKSGALVRGFVSGEFLAPLLRGTDADTLVRIGSETEVEQLEDYALVAAGYRTREGGGSIGILGPKRMDYRRVIGVVNHMKRRLEEILS